MRLAVYCDFPYRRFQGNIYADQAFVLFLSGMRNFVDRLVLVGRLESVEAGWHYVVPPSVGFAALPHYTALYEPVRVLRVIFSSCRRFWRVLDDVDAVWLFGPHPLALVFALLAMSRRKRVVLGFRQDYLEYVRSRHPGRTLLYAYAFVLDAAFHLLARKSAVVTVGRELGRQYAKAKRLLATNIVLVGEKEVIADSDPLASSVGDGWTVLSVGRLDAEKNPLLLADVLARLLERDERRWRLIVCGEGPLKERLQERLEVLGIAGQAELRGYVPVGEQLFRIYRDSDFFLHTSLTEGVPQVLFETFAAGLPVVATDVGAVAETAAGAAVLVAPGDADAAAEALRGLAQDEQQRINLVAAGLRLVRAQSREAQCQRVTEFIAA